MNLKKIIFVFTSILLLNGCSTSYKELSKIKLKKGTNFQNYLVNEYKSKAIFEAEEMHDWNSAKLYSEKALKSLNTDNIYPEKITYWKLPANKLKEIEIAHENLFSIYKDAKIIEPYNLAKAISSLDCWAEQQEENWQTWDINKCKENFFNSMHTIYKKISINEKESKKRNVLNKEYVSNYKASVVTKNNNEELMQIIYFDFDKSKLSHVSRNKVKFFLDKYKENINEYLIVGHTDTKGTKKYNLSLSLKRAEIVKSLLIENGVDLDKIKILGMGEKSLAIFTPDETKQPANRRVELKKIN